jgi:hypothetical protein
MKRLAPHASLRLTPARALWPLGALALAASACGQAPDESAAKQAPVVIDASPGGARSGPPDGGRRGAPDGEPGTIVRVNDCDAGAGYEINSYEGTSSGDDLLAIGVYDAGGEAVVRDTRATPHDLALSVYEATHWRIEAAPGSGLRRVLVSGFNPQTVDAPPGVEVVDLNAGRSRRLPTIFSFAPDGYSDPGDLVRAAQAATGGLLTAFTGCYDASDFSVNDGPGAGQPHPFDPCAAEGAPRTATAVGSDCASGREALPSAELSCEGARAACRQHAERNPGQSVSCTWDGQIVYEREAAVGACTDPGLPDACVGTQGEGSYVMSLCRTDGGYLFTQGISCSEAYDNCLLNADANPEESITCVWNDQTLFERELTPGTCDVLPTPPPLPPR